MLLPKGSQELPSSLLIWSHWDEHPPHCGVNRSLVLYLKASVWHWCSPSSIPLACREGKGDEMGEPLLEPDAALIGALVSPTPSCAVHAVSVQCWGWLSIGGCSRWSMLGHEGSLLKPAAWNTRSWCLHLPVLSLCQLELSAQPQQHCTLSGGPRISFPAGSIQRQLHGSSAYGGNRTPWLQCPWSLSETCCLSLPPLACSSLVVLQQFYVLCLSVEGKWYPGP